MSSKELSPDELEQLKKDKEGSDARDTDREESVAEGRDARDSEDAVTKAALLKGYSIFDSDVGDGQLSVLEEEEALEAQGGSAATAGEKLTKKAIDVDLRKKIYSAGGIYYVSASAREVCKRSMEKQGVKISDIDLTAKPNVAGTRGRFNVFNKNHPKHYASGSHKTDGGGPRIQGPSGGPGSCKFVIIQR